MQEVLYKEQTDKGEYKILRFHESIGALYFPKSQPTEPKRIFTPEEAVKYLNRAYLYKGQSVDEAFEAIEKHRIDNE